MAGTVKQKIRLGTLFFFALLMFSGGVGIYYLIRLKDDANLILRNNYESLDYCHAMQQALDSIPDDKKYLTRFDSILKLQESNTTEPGEKTATNILRDEFQLLSQGESSVTTRNKIDQQLQEILYLNMAAIEKKNKIAEDTAQQALMYISIISAVVFIVALTFAFNFPTIITGPINDFMEAIRQIADKNYKHRITSTSNDEFGQMAAAFNAMAERLEYFESSNLNKLIFEKARAEAVINSLKDASIGINRNNTILFANQQALQLLGLRAEDTIGNAVADLTARNDLLRFLISDETNKPFKIVVDGKENYYTKEVIEVAQSDTTSRVIVLKNITSFKELDVAKTNFIATISHELKTPLASSDFSLKLLEDKRIGQLTGEQKELVDQLKNDNQRMLRILSELLNMSQVEAGKIQLSMQLVNPESVVAASVQAVFSAAREKQITISEKLAGNLPDIKTDPDKINWVLNNFLTNAIKNSPQESNIVISVSRNDDTISFAVADKGQGIDEQYLDQIFERYFQVPGRTDKKGSGIGLAICKEFIEAMNGKIWVKSKTGEGSIFGFDLPVVS